MSFSKFDEIAELLTDYFAIEHGIVNSLLFLSGKARAEAARRNTCIHFIFWNVAGDHRTGSDDGASTNRDARHDNGSASDPDIVPNPGGRRSGPSRIAHWGTRDSRIMIPADDANARTEHGVRPNRHVRSDNAIGTDVGVRAGDEVAANAPLASQVECRVHMREAVAKSDEPTDGSMMVPVYPAGAPKYASDSDEQRPHRACLIRDDRNSSHPSSIAGSPRTARSMIIA